MMTEAKQSLTDLAAIILSKEGLVGFLFTIMIGYMLFADSQQAKRMETLFQAVSRNLESQKSAREAQLELLREDNSQDRQWLALFERDLNEDYKRTDKLLEVYRELLLELQRGNQ